MNRSQSTPGLVEPGSKKYLNVDRATIIRMPSMPAGLPQADHENYQHHPTHSVPEPQSHHQPVIASIPVPTTSTTTTATLSIQFAEKPKETSPFIVASSALPMSSSRAGAGYHSPQPPHSMYTANVPNSGTTTISTSLHHLTVPNNTGKPTTSSQQSVSRSTTPGTIIIEENHVCQPTASSTTEELTAEIRRLRERLVQLETENASMSIKLSQQQWEVEHRLAEIEMHICGSESPSGSDFSELTVSNLPTLEKPNRESII